VLFNLKFSTSSAEGQGRRSQATAKPTPMIFDHAIMMNECMEEEAINAN